MTNKRTKYMRKYFKTHKVERHFTNRKYYYSHKYLWHKNDNSLGSLSTQKIYESNIENSKSYIHNYVEYIRHYKSQKSNLNQNKDFNSEINNSKSEINYLNYITEDDE